VVVDFASAFRWWYERCEKCVYVHCRVLHWKKAKNKYTCTHSCLFEVFWESCEHTPYTMFTVTQETCFAMQWPCKTVSGIKNFLPDSHYVDYWYLKN
jgi:hypothetical protein